tara:strand:+ start:349 stop:1668 length:1320 start_codon:yes stop_codon:yes gene_type:complete
MQSLKILAMVAVFYQVPVLASTTISDLDRLNEVYIRNAARAIMGDFQADDRLDYQFQVRAKDTRSHLNYVDLGSLLYSIQQGKISLLRLKEQRQPIKDKDTKRSLDSFSTMLDRYEIILTNLSKLSIQEKDVDKNLSLMEQSFDYQLKERVRKHEAKYFAQKRQIEKKDYEEKQRQQLLLRNQHQLLSAKRQAFVETASLFLRDLQIPTLNLAELSSSRMVALNSYAILANLQHLQSHPSYYPDFFRNLRIEHDMIPILRSYMNLDYLKDNYTYALLKFVAKNQSMHSLIRLSAIAQMTKLWGFENTLQALDYDRDRLLKIFDKIGERAEISPVSRLSKQTKVHIDYYADVKIDVDDFARKIQNELFIYLPEAKMHFSSRSSFAKPQLLALSDQTKNGNIKPMSQIHRTTEQHPLELLQERERQSAEVLPFGVCKGLFR